MMQYHVVVRCQGGRTIHSTCNRKRNAQEQADLVHGYVVDDDNIDPALASDSENEDVRNEYRW